MAPQKQKPLKLALIGCGDHGLNSHAAALTRYAAEHPDQVELTAACDIDPGKASRACEQFGFANAAADIAAMIRDHAPEACICALPCDETLLQGSQLLAQGMPCVFELPLGGSLDEVMEISDAAGEMNTPHMVAFNRRTNPYLTRGVAWASQLGPIESIACTLSVPATAEPRWFHSTVVHAVDVIGHILGRLTAFTLATSEMGPAIELELADGRRGSIAVVSEAEAVSEAYEVLGAGVRAVATLTGPEGPSLMGWRGDAMEINIAGKANEPAAAADGVYDLLAGFIESFRAQSACSPSIDEALPAVDLTCQIVAQWFDAA